MRFVSAAVVVCSALLALAGCESPAKSRAFRVEQRAQLIGGPRALGEVGDWMLENGKVRFLIQDAGFSRGFGVFGGALLDADLVREQSGRGNSEGGTGDDNFGEMFPAFFLEALDPQEVFDPTTGDKLPPIVVENDGTNGEAAVLVVRGFGGDFIALTQNVNQVLLGDDRGDPRLFFETRYVLEPEAQFIKMTTRVQTVGTAVNLPNAQLGDAVVPTPFGDVMLFGAGNKVFAPHPAGFDIRFTLEDIYASNSVQLPALPGITAEFIASAGKNVSYGLLAEPPTAPTENFVLRNADQFQNAKPHSIHIPFLASAFTGVFQVLPPERLEQNDFTPGGPDEMSFSRYFIVGDGDVAAISDVVYGLLGDRIGTLEGRARFEGSGEGLDGASIVVLADDGAKVTQMKVDVGGRFQAKLRPGTYSLVVVKEGLASTRFDGVVVAEGATTHQELALPQPASLVVTIVEEGGVRIPAKVSLVGITPPEHVGQLPKTWLFNQSIGEPFRYTDFVDDAAGDASTLRYIEHFEYAKDGTLTMHARPGNYTVVIGRGLEYDRVEIPVSLEAGKSAVINATLRKAIDTSGYVGGDFHLHSVFSLDSNASLADRIASYAGEGVEYAVATDHNFVVDYRATIEKLGLQRFVNSAIGLELTTIDRGHFNGFPLDRGTGIDEDTIKSRTYGSFEWALRDPGDIFTDLRALGRKDANGAVSPIVLQVNHPRDSILGYFDQYGVNAETLEVEGQSGLIAPDPVTHPEFSKDAFSFDFDAIEVFNGKRFEFLQTFKVPGGVTRDPVSCCVLAPGDVMREYPGPDCGEDVADELCNCVPENCLGENAAVCEARTTAQIAADNCNPAKFPVAFPGVVDDWFHVLQTGKRVAGTANSDSHEPDKEEPGSPRTYFRAPTDDPAQVGPDDVVAAFAAGDLLMTNGPFVRVDMGGVGMGGLATGTSHTLKIHVEQAPWVKANQARVFVGDKEAVRILGPFDVAHPIADLEVTVDGIDGDSFVVVEVASFDESTSLFPSIYPNEIPPLQFTDVIGALGSSFGFGSVEGALQPQLTFVTTPYALTNPIYVDADSDGAFNPGRTIPGQPGSAQVAAAQPKPQLGLTRPIVTVPTEEEARQREALAAWNAIPLRKRVALTRLPRWLWPSNDPRDVRRSLVQFTRHND